MNKIKNFLGFDLNESTAPMLKENAAYYIKNGYIEDPSIDSEKTLLDKIEKEINPAFQEFIKKNNLPITGAVISISKGNRGTYINLKTDEVKDLGVFANALSSCTFVFFSGREIDSAEVDVDGEKKFMFKPSIWSTLNLSYESKRGGGNGMNYSITEDPNNHGRECDLWYDIKSGQFLNINEYIKGT